MCARAQGSLSAGVGLPLKRVRGPGVRAELQYGLLRRCGRGCWCARRVACSANRLRDVGPTWVASWMCVGDRVGAV
eukprot:7391698-Prymnesium_polylepis.2